VVDLPTGDLIVSGRQQPVNLPERGGETMSRKAQEICISYFHWQLCQLWNTAREFEEGSITLDDFLYSVEEITLKLLHTLEGI